MRPALYLAALLGLTLSVQGQSSIVYNGNFEGGWNNGPLGWGWTDSVALTGDGLNNYAEVFGSLYQDLATSPGQPYSLNFRMAGNYPIMNLAILNVMWGEEMIGTVTWNSAGDDTNDPGWVYAEFDVIASASTTRLTFDNPLATNNIPLPLWFSKIDDVQVVIAPEPSVWILGGVGSVVLFATRRRLSR